LCEEAPPKPFWFFYLQTNYQICSQEGHTVKISPLIQTTFKFSVFDLIIFAYSAWFDRFIAIVWLQIFWTRISWNLFVERQKVQNLEEVVLKEMSKKEARSRGSQYFRSIISTVSPMIRTPSNFLLSIEILFFVTINIAEFWSL